MYRHRLGIMAALLAGLLGAAGILALLGNLAGGVAPAEAGTDAVLTVCREGPPACDYAVIQDAVDAAAEGDVIKVATGVYTGVQARPAPPGYEGPAVITQVVYISKSLSLQGGYTVTNWIDPDPELNPTVADALGAGRVVAIIGPISATVQGLHIMGGDAAGLGGFNEHDAGGGIGAMTATVTVRDNVISNNRADYGAGVNLSGCSARLSGNLFTANAANFDGGGLNAYQSHVLAEANTFYTNTAEWNGGGLFAYQNDVRIVRNLLAENHAGMWGGGIGAYQCLTLTIQDNQVMSNTAIQGGGMLMTVYSVTLRGNLVVGNVAETDSGGMLVGADTAILEENTIMGNSSGGETGGLYLAAQSALVGNNVITENQAPWGAGGMRLMGGQTAVVENTIISNTTGAIGGGLSLEDGEAAIVGNIFRANEATYGGGLSISVNPDVTTTWTTTVSGNTMVENSGQLSGGGACIWGYHGRIDFSDNLVLSNTVSVEGGGLMMWNEESDITLSGNIFSGNAAGYFGGGVCLYLGAVTLTENMLAGNTADYGGGLCWFHAEGALTENRFIHNNAAHDGGGLLLSDGYSPSPVVPLMGNVLISNTAGDDGGGAMLLGLRPVLTNNLVADNHADHSGSGLYLAQGTAPRLVHTTIANNTGGDGSGIYLGSEGPGAPQGVVLTNTIIVGHAVGITAAAGTTATLEATLWGNEIDWAGDGTIVTGTVNVWGDPAFADPIAGDYHIWPGSAAIDAGVDAGVTVDIDGEPRPVGMGYDIGADEIQAAMLVTKSAFPDPVLAGRPLTYTLAVTNNGLLTLTAAITDTLPPQVIPTGVLTWSVGALEPGEAWGAQVVVTVAADYSGILTNVLRAASAEGAGAAYTLTTMAYRPVRADFAGMPTAGPAPLAVTFTNTSTGDFDTSLWFFGDGVTSTLQHPAHTYGAAGAYTVTLTVSGPGGTDTLSRPGYITAYESVHADFVAQPTAGLPPLTVVFSNTSAGDYATSLWQFGDGITSTLTSPTHTYTAAGVYTVTLTIDGPGGTDTEVKERYITAQYGVYLPVILRRG